MKLHLGQGLTLPVEAAGETFLIVGKRGSGKSTTATRFAEQLIHAHVPIAVLDPVDVWWGLKSGLEVYVFGGEHSDLPLEAGAGSLMADVVVDHRVNVVMVLRAFSNRDKARFVADFADQLYKRNRETMHLFCEEAHEVMPQNPYGGEEEMLGRMLRLEKQGRTSGIGMTAITQRPASLNKNATTQAEILVAHRTLGPQDVKALDGWIQYHQQQDARQEVLASLATLKTGEAWFWAPDFPEDEPIGLKRVQVLAPETFDSRRTPKPGERRAAPKALAPVDLDKLREKMANTIERAKAEDPKALRQRVRELEAQVKAVRPTEKVVTRVEHKPVFTTEERAELRQLRIALPKAIDEAHQAAGRLEEWTEEAQKIVAALSAAPASGSAAVAAARAAAPAPRLDRPSTTPAPARAGGKAIVRTREPRATDAGEAGLTSTHQAVLNAALFLEGVGFRTPGVPQLALTAGLSPTGGYWRQIIGRLRTLGLVQGTSLTPAGRSQAVQEPIGGPQDVQARVRDVLPSSTHKAVFDALIGAYPAGLDQDDERLPKGGYGRQIVGRLRSLGIAGKGWPLTAAPFLFLEEAA